MRRWRSLKFLPKGGQRSVRHWRLLFCRVREIWAEVASRLERERGGAQVNSVPVLCLSRASCGIAPGNELTSRWCEGLQDSVGWKCIKVEENSSHFFLIGFGKADEESDRDFCEEEVGITVISKLAVSKCTPRGPEPHPRVLL